MGNLIEEGVKIIQDAYEKGKEEVEDFVEDIEEVWEDEIQPQLVEVWDTIVDVFDDALNSTGPVDFLEDIYVDLVNDGEPIREVDAERLIDDANLSPEHVMEVITNVDIPESVEGMEEIAKDVQDMADALATASDEDLPEVLFQHLLELADKGRDYAIDVLTQVMGKYGADFALQQLGDLTPKALVEAFFAKKFASDDTEVDVLSVLLSVAIHRLHDEYTTDVLSNAIRAVQSMAMIANHGTMAWADALADMFDIESSGAAWTQEIGNNVYQCVALGPYVLAISVKPIEGLDARVFKTREAYTTVGADIVKHLPEGFVRNTGKVVVDIMGGYEKQEAVKSLLQQDSWALKAKDVRIMMNNLLSRLANRDQDTPDENPGSEDEVVPELPIKSPSEDEATDEGQRRRGRVPPSQSDNTTAFLRGQARRARLV